MHPSPSRSRSIGFSLIEFLMLLGCLVVLIGIFSPLLSNRNYDRRRGRIHCVNNLKQVGIALRTYAVDFGGLYPWQERAAGGAILSPSNAVSADLIRYFSSVSNELSTPRILSCSADERANLGTNRWDTLRDDSNLAHRVPSYFLGLTATEELPASILSGDRNLTNGPPANLDWRTVGTRTPVWKLPQATNSIRTLGFDSRTIHQASGNLLLGDGSVQQVSNGRLRDAVGEPQQAGGIEWLFPVDH